LYFNIKDLKTKEHIAKKTGVLDKVVADFKKV